MFPTLKSDFSETDKNVYENYYQFSNLIHAQ